METRTFICRFKATDDTWYKIYWNSKNMAHDPERFVLITEANGKQIDIAQSLFPLIEGVYRQVYWKPRHKKRFIELQVIHDYPEYMIRVGNWSK